MILMLGLTLKAPASCMILWRAMVLSDSSLLRDSVRRANKLLEPKFARTCSACWFLLLCVGEGVGESEAEGLTAWVGWSSRLSLEASWALSSPSDSDSEPEYITRPLFPLAAHVPVGFLLSPGDLLARLAEVRVGRDGE